MSDEKEPTQPELNARREKLYAMARRALDEATRPGDRVEITRGELKGRIGVVTELHYFDKAEDGLAACGATVHFDDMPDPGERDLFYGHDEYRRLPREEQQT